MGSERGQATVEWTGLLLLVALVLVAVGHLASRADGRELGTTLAHSVAHPGRPAARPARLRPAPVPPPARPVEPPVGPVRPPAGRVEQGLARDILRRAGGESARRAGRGAGALWRRAWFACLVYERVRYAIRHPESRRPDYTFPYDVALRMINSCAIPVDVLRDLPELDPGP